MNKNLLKMRHYGMLISQVMEETEGTQEKMSPKFTPIREAIDADKLADFDKEEYKATLAIFNEGTNAYRALHQKLQNADAPARLMGNHKMIVTAYGDFVAGCQAMIDSMKDEPEALDVAAFDAAEAAQDEASGRLMKRITKASQII